MIQAKRNRLARPSYLARSEVLNSPLLVVEDQRALAMMQAAMLKERWGCEVHIAETMQRARELLTTGTPYFAACCDLNLPDAPDGEVIDLLVAADIPTIAVTAAFGGEIRQKMIDKGVVDYVLKNSINAYAYVCELVGFIRKNQLTKILIVDDDASVHRILSNILTRFRLSVLLAKDGKEGLRLAKEHPDIRLAILDYELPGINGINLTTTLRENFGKDRLAIIGISGSSEKLLGAEFLKNGANDFIAKPFSFEEVVCRVNQNLEMLNLIEENRNAAYRDYLTGLPNRRSFFADGPSLLIQAGKHGRPIAVAMLDIDHFKRVNDVHGHDIGDAALCHVSDAISAAFPDQLVARLGGEEFGILIDGMVADSARAMLEGFLASLATTPLDVAGQPLFITASIGLVCADKDGVADLDVLLKTADTRLYAAKANGRNQVAD